MKPSEVRRVKNLTMTRLRKDEVVCVCGLSPKLARAAHIRRFVDSGQVVLIKNFIELKDASPATASLCLVADNQSLALEAKRQKLKVEHHDFEGIKDVLAEALVDEVFIDSIKAVPVKTKKVAPAPQLGTQEGASQMDDDDRANAQPAPAAVVSEPVRASELDPALNPMQEFAVKFLAHPAAETADGVGSRDTNSIVQSIEDLGKNARNLCELGWLEAVVREGKQRIGGYRPTDKLRVFAPGTPEMIIADADAPEDKYQRALWLQKRVPDLEARKAQLEAEIESIEEELARAEKAADWLKEGDF